MLTLPPRDWREKQAAEIKGRDEAATRKRQETIAQANQFIDDFYLEHKENVERNIKQNKCVRTICWDEGCTKLLT
jgi:Clathrin light chain